MRYYTLEETAVLLGDSPDNVFEMTTGLTEPVLWPAAYFELAVKVNRHIHNKINAPHGANSYGWGVGYTTVEEEVRGCFSVTSFGGSPFLKWNKSKRAKVGILTHDNLKYFVIGDRFISKNDLRISSTSLASVMSEEGIPVPEDLHTELLKQNQNETLDSHSEQKKGGRHKSPLSEAIEFVYMKYFAEGNTEILRSGKIREFIKRLKELADEKGNKDFSTYVADRIDSVKIFPSGCTVTTKEQILKCNERRDRVEKSIDYSQHDVSKKLTELRKEYPLQM
jgi:hypothetical protein